jgi:hypothetical protein
MGTFCATVLYYCRHYSSLVLAERRGKTMGGNGEERERERSADASSGHVRTELGLGCLHFDLKRLEVHVLSTESRTRLIIGGWSGFVFFCCGTSVSAVFSF